MGWGILSLLSFHQLEKQNLLWEGLHGTWIWLHFPLISCAMLMGTMKKMKVMLTKSRATWPNPPTPPTQTRSLTTQGFMLSPSPYPWSPSCPGQGEDVGSLSESHVWDGLASPKHGVQKSNPYIRMWEVEGVSCSSQRFYLDLNWVGYGNFLAVQWLRLCFHCRGPGFNPCSRN